jgi:hypothetical protein
MVRIELYDDFEVLCEKYSTVCITQDHLYTSHFERYDRLYIR